MINQPSVEYLQIGENEDNQRIDNFLIKHFRTIPKSHLYQILRSGQVRVNGKRINAKYRLQIGETLRIPPLKIESGNLTAQKKVPPSSLFQFNRLYEDDAMLVIDKPSGIAVHGGSGVSFGVIEQLRAQHPLWKFLELIHRLDRETSGVLMLAKKRSALVELHKQIREGSTEKHYLVMVKGEWKNTKQHVRLALNKYVAANGERRVAISTPAKNGEAKSMEAHTVFRLEKTWKQYSLLDAELKTGRTHQIRVHLAHLGFPILGDDKYGDFELNKKIARVNNGTRLQRMFLHAYTMRIKHPLTAQYLNFKSPLPKELSGFVNAVDASTSAGSASSL